MYTLLIIGASHLVTFTIAYLINRRNKLRIVPAEKLAQEESDMRIRVQREISQLHYDRHAALNSHINKLGMDIKKLEREIYKRSEREAKLRRTVAFNIAMVRRDAAHGDFMVRFANMQKMWQYFDGYLDMVQQSVDGVK